MLSDDVLRARAVPVCAGSVANLALGASSLYWRALGALPPTTLLAYRVLASMGSLVLALFAMRGFLKLRSSLNARLIGLHTIAAILVAINWGTFIIASIEGHVVESGLGYLIAPFIAIAGGFLAFREPMSHTRALAIFCILAAVVCLLRVSGELSHWIYLTIGGAWGGYACLKKMTTLDPVSGLFVETLVLTALVPGLLALRVVSLTLPAGFSPSQTLLLAACGLVSVAPLWLFASAARRLPLSTMGFLQFILPTMQFVVALTIYRQTISAATAIVFIVIWTALLIIVFEPIWKSRRASAPACIERDNGSL